MEKEIYVLLIQDHIDISTYSYVSENLKDLWEFALDDAASFIGEFKEEDCSWYEEGEGFTFEGQGLAGGEHLTYQILTPTNIDSK